MKKIDTVTNIGVTTFSSERIPIAIIRYQAKRGCKGESAMVKDLPGNCVSYLEGGFLVEDGSNWYFYNEAGTLVSTRAKSEIGKCVHVSVLGNLYVFERTMDLNGIKINEEICIDSSGVTRPFPKQFRKMPCSELLSTLFPEDNEESNAPAFVVGKGWTVWKILGRQLNSSKI